MKTEKQKMLTGELYSPWEKQLRKERDHARAVIFDFNSLPPKEKQDRNFILKQLLGKTEKTFLIEPPFRCDYGSNIEIGDNFFANFNCIFLDCAKIKIGNNVMLGPNVQLYTASHPIDAETRNKGWEYALPITIGDHVWIGGNVVINPGVKIGDRAVIGAGSVVTKDIPAGVIAFGNPCRVNREIKPQE